MAGARPLPTEPTRERLAKIEHSLQNYGDGPPYYASEEDAAMGRMVADIQWLHDELLKAWSWIDAAVPQ